MEVFEEDYLDIVKAAMALSGFDVNDAEYADGTYILYAQLLQ